jgi:hypothetical protein
MVFHSPQEAHFPAHREETAPHDWQTKLVLAALAIGSPCLDLRREIA